MLDVKMREPREGVADDETKRKINPISAAENPNQQNDAERRADKMQIARQRFAVFLNVKIPELRVIFYVVICFSHKINMPYEI